MPRNGAGALDKLVDFEPPMLIKDSAGGTESGWNSAAAIRRYVGFIYQRGRESEQGGKLTGSAVFKVKLRNSSKVKEITTDWRMRHLSKNVAYQIREIDTMSDRQWAWMVVEAGVAV